MLLYEYGGSGMFVIMKNRAIITKAIGITDFWCFPQYWHNHVWHIQSDSTKIIKS